MLFIIKEYLTSDGVSPFGKWFEDLNARAAVKVRIAITRMELGNFSIQNLLEKVFGKQK